MTPIEKLRRIADMTALEGVADAIREVADEMDWRPIETAPKDGALFLCWVRALNLHEGDDFVQYEQDASDVDFCRWRRCDESPNGGYFDNMAGQIADLQHVTHWMPLPPTPATKQFGGE